MLEGKEYGRIECKVGKENWVLRSFGASVFVTMVLVVILLSTPVFPPTCYTHISSILARNWMCKDSLERFFNVECAHAEVNHLEP